MKLRETIKVYPLLGPDDFGDSNTSTGVSLAAQVESALGWGHSSYADTNGGQLTAWIHPDHGLETLSGLEADYDGLRYRITSVRPMTSLVTGADDLVELVMEKINAS